MLTFYVAGNWTEYQAYRKRKEQEGKDVSNWRYVSSVSDLRGLSEVKGFYIGDYESRPDIEEIREAIHIIKGKP
jgi:hypothetical protein